MKGGAMMRESLQMLAVGVGVTVIGLLVGAVVVSPAVSPTQRLLGIGALALVAAVFFAARLVRRALRQRPARTPRTPRQTAAPTIKLGGGRNTRTPRAVAALAAAGADPSEIARKTGLSFDAVSMLLRLAGGAVPTTV